MWRVKDKSANSTFVAIVGPSGSGKSTLAAELRDLLCGINNSIVHVYISNQENYLFATRLQRWSSLLFDPVLVLVMLKSFLSPCRTQYTLKKAIGNFSVLARARWLHKRRKDGVVIVDQGPFVLPSSIPISAGIYGSYRPDFIFIPMRAFNSLDGFHECKCEVSKCPIQNLGIGFLGIRHFFGIVDPALIHCWGADGSIMENFLSKEIWILDMNSI